MTARIQRVVVLLDAVSENDMAIETAAHLAERTKTTLHGVFVEDADLLRLARMPFARTITVDSGAAQLTPEQAENQLHAAAEHARQQLIEAASRRRLNWSFEVVEGAAETAFSAASEHDLVVACTLTRPIAGGFRVDCRWLSATEAIPGRLLVARAPWSAGGSVVVLLNDRGTNAARLLETAAQIAEAHGRLLAIICATTAENAPDFETWIGERVGSFAAGVRIEAAPAETAALQRRLAELGCRLLSIVAQSADHLRELTERFGCDILVVSEPGP